MYECIIVPQSLTLTVTIVASNGKSYQFVGTAEETFESGYAYTLNLEVGRDKVTLGEITAKAWQENNGGTLETE